MISEEDKREIIKLIEEQLVIFPGDYSFIARSIKGRHISGLITLGGENDVDGIIHIEDSNGVVRISIDKDGITASDTTTNRVFLGTDGSLKVSRATYDVLTTDPVNLAFDSSKSTIREVQMQTNAEQRFTDQVTYQEYNDCQIQIDFSDWVDHTMYFEAVMKTGAGTGYMRLYNITDSSELVEISTTSTSAVSVRSAAIDKSALTGVKSFRESQKIVGGSGAYTDIYIGRVIMRFVY